MAAALLFFMGRCDGMAQLFGRAFQHVVHRIGLGRHDHGLQSTEMVLHHATLVVLTGFLGVDIRDMHLYTGNMVTVRLQRLANHVIDVVLKARVVRDVAIGLELDLHKIVLYRCSFVIRDTPPLSRD